MSQRPLARVRQRRRWVLQPPQDQRDHRGVHVVARVLQRGELITVHYNNRKRPVRMEPSNREQLQGAL